MVSSRDVAVDQRIRGQGRILEALAADDAILTGTLARIGQQFGLTTDDLRACLRELVRARWIAVQTQPFGRLTVRLERRSDGAASSQMAERRRTSPDAWRL
jgi:DNA-binding transcriptional regulator PaaX